MADFSPVADYSFGVAVISFFDTDRLPAVGVEALRPIFGKGHFGPGRRRHRVVVVEADQLAELQVSGQRRGFRGHAFHEITVADDRPRVVVDDRVPCAVVARREMRLADRHADRIGQPLAERSGRHLDAGRVATLGMARRLAAPLAKLPEVVERQVVAGDVQQAVKQRRAMASR